MNRNLLFVILALFTWGLGEGLFLYFQPIYLQQLGADPVLIGAILGGMGVAMALAQIPAGILSDRIGSRTMMWISWVIGTVAAIVMVYATGLGREYFGFSFVPRSARDFLSALLLLAVGLSAFLLLTVLSGSITYTGNLWRSDWTTLYNATFMWLMIVGISEEVIFRCGILTLTTAYLARRSQKIIANWSRYPRLSAVLFTSILFGLVHLYRGMTFAFLAFIASLLYSLSFVVGRSLSGPVLLHGLLNVLILRNFQF